MRREDLRTLLTALGLADQSSNPNRISAVEAWRTSQEALRADAGNNLLSVHDVVQLTSDAAKMGPIVSIDASAGSLTVKFDGESTTTTVPLASVQRWTRDGTTGQQPDPKRQRTHNGIAFTVKAIAVNSGDIPNFVEITNDAAPTGQWVESKYVSAAASAPSAAGTGTSTTGTSSAQAALAAAQATLLTGAEGAPAVGTGLSMLNSVGLGKHGVPGTHTQSALGAVTDTGHPQTDPTTLPQMLAGLKNAAAGAAIAMAGPSAGCCCCGCCGC